MLNNLVLLIFFSYSHKIWAEESISDVTSCPRTGLSCNHVVNVLPLAVLLHVYQRRRQCRSVR